MDGLGIYVFANEDQYEGEFKQGRMIRQGDAEQLREETPEAETGHEAGTAVQTEAPAVESEDEMPLIKQEDTSGQTI